MSMLSSTTHGKNRGDPMLLSVMIAEAMGNVWLELRIFSSLLDRREFGRENERKENLFENGGFCENYCRHRVVDFILAIPGRESAENEIVACSTSRQGSALHWETEL